MADGIEPSAIVQNAASAAALIAEARAIDATIHVDLGRAINGVRKRGELLLKAKAAVRHGNWQSTLKANWPSLPERSAQRYMRMAKSAKVADLTAVTHKRLESDEEEVEASATPPLTADERKRLIRLIDTTKPGLAKKLRDGRKTMTDAELQKAVPPSCDKCRRFGPPAKPCDTCAQMRKDSLFGLQEPENPDDPISAPKPPEDPFKQAKSWTAKLSGHFTKLAAENGDLYRAFVACGLMDHPPGKSPRFVPLEGVSRVVTEVSRGETDVEKIKLAFQETCGPWLPERTRQLRARKGKK